MDALSDVIEREIDATFMDLSIESITFNEHNVIQYVVVVASKRHYRFLWEKPIFYVLRSNTEIALQYTGCIAIDGSIRISNSEFVINSRRFSMH